MRRPSAEEMLNHPWMQALRAELADVEDDGGAMYHDAAGSPDASEIRNGDRARSRTPVQAQTELARAAHLLEERQMEDIMSSPPEELDAELS